MHDVETITKEHAPKQLQVRTRFDLLTGSADSSESLSRALLESRLRFFDALELLLLDFMS